MTNNQHSHLLRRERMAAELFPAGRLVDYVYQDDLGREYVQWSIRRVDGAYHVWNSAGARVGRFALFAAAQTAGMACPIAAEPYRAAIWEAICPAVGA